MHVVVVDFAVNPERMAEFLPLMKVQAQNSLDLEDGCKRFDVCIDRHDPNRILLYELYVDDAAFQSHLKSAHFIAFDRAVSDMVVEKTVRTLQLA
ncbi:MAG: putative quinol monooxygenase [Rhodobacter sp.]|nr:putative quinol monooxygenase [Rhodobacter sp.]